MVAGPLAMSNNSATKVVFFLHIEEVFFVNFSHSYKNGYFRDLRRVGASFLALRSLPPKFVIMVDLSHQNREKCVYGGG